MTSFKTVIRNHPVLTYFILTFIISWGGGFIVLGPDGIIGIRQPSQTQFLLAIFAGIIGPGVAGILLSGLVDGRSGLHDLRSRLFKWRIGARWYLVALLTGPLIGSVALFALSLTSSEYLPAILISEHKVSLFLIGIVAGLVIGFLEELGWTGFVIPRLRLRHGILTTGLIVGFLWGVWHAPLFSGQSSSSGMPATFYLSVLLFSFLPPFRVLMVWLYDRTESLLIVMIMHAGLSATSQILQPQTPGVKVVVNDLVFATALWIVIAVVTVANRRRLKSREN